MFNYRKLNVYQLAKSLALECYTLTNNKQIDWTIKNQLRRASLSVMLNIAEGNGRGSKPDERRFYIIARGSVLECTAILDLLSERIFSQDVNEIKRIEKMMDRVSAMLFALIAKLKSH